MTKKEDNIKICISTLRDLEGILKKAMQMKNEGYTKTDAAYAVCENISSGDMKIVAGITRGIISEQRELMNIMINTNLAFIYLFNAIFSGDTIHNVKDSKKLKSELSKVKKELEAIKSMHSEMPQDAKRMYE